MPEGAHKCIKCDKNVHLFKGCSITIPGEEEGYGSKRICMDCYSTDSLIPNDVTIDNLNETPKRTRRDSFYQNEGPPKKKTKRRPAKYFGERPDDIKDSLLFDKNKSFPLIKNGNNVHLSSKIVDGKKVLLNNTCAFDSIYYLLMVAASDFPMFYENVSIRYFWQFK